MAHLLEAETEFRAEREVHLETDEGKAARDLALELYNRMLADRDAPALDHERSRDDFPEYLRCSGMNRRE